MLYDTNWLKEGQPFPPRSELERLKTYRDNRALFRGETEQVLPAYRKRIRAVLEKFSGVPQWDFKSDLNYWQLVTLKTGDLICGEPPTITAGGEDGRIEDILSQTSFNDKLLETVYDVSRFGDSVVRVVKDEGTGKNNFIVTPPDLWFPIVSRENVKEVKEHCIAWVEDVTPSGSGRKEFLLKVQEHFKGYYISRTFSVKDHDCAATFVLANGLNVTLPTYKIGKEIQAPVKTVTGLSDFAIVVFQNVTLSDSVYAQVNDYDRITDVLAELEVRYALENTVLDKHSAPTVYAPQKSLSTLPSGEWVFPTGGMIPVEKDEQPPGYMTWDGSLENNHVMIERLERHLYSLSEMGAIVNDDAFGASQGFEALETRMTNARLKARRLSNHLTGAVRKLVALLSEIGFDKMEEHSISVCWNDGIPNNEYREADIALKKQPFFSTKSLLKDHFGKTEEDAEREVETRSRELTETAGMGFSFGAGGGASGEAGGISDGEA